MTGASAMSARELLQTGALGTVPFCRVSKAGMRKAALAIAGRETVIEVDSLANGMTFLGSRATLVLNRNGCRVFSPDAL
jgi:hypothetical protein